ncbi:general secretion pathway protein M [Oxalobacteraceae bacterium GrIS 1.11]
MKNISLVLGRFKAGAAEFWLARNEQERKTLAIGGCAFGLALVYAILIGPAIDGRAKLKIDLPQLRQDAAEIDALAKEAGLLAQQTPAPLTPMSRDNLNASLAARGLSAQSINLTADYAKLQLTGVPFAGLTMWLDAQRRENHIEVQDAALTAQTTLGMVDAAITLHQGAGENK